MITNLFKNNVLSYLIVVVTGAFLWALAYLSVSSDIPVLLEVGGQEFFLPKNIAFILSFFICMIPGWALNYKLRKHLFSYEPNNLFLFFYVLIVSLGLTSPNFLTYSVILALLAYVLINLLLLVEKKSVEKQLFNSGLVIGLLSFHNPFFVLLMLLLVYNLSAIKRTSIREIFSIIVGYCIPVIYTFLFSSLTDNTEFIAMFFQFDWTFLTIKWQFILVILAMLIIAFQGYRIVMAKRSGIDITMLRLTKNLFAALIIFLVISILSGFLFEQGYLFYVLVMPISIFLTDYFANSSSRWKESILLILVAITFLLR